MLPALDHPPEPPIVIEALPAPAVQPPAASPSKVATPAPIQARAARPARWCPLHAVARVASTPPVPMLAEAAAERGSCLR